MGMNGRQRQGEAKRHSMISRAIAVVAGACVSLSAPPGTAATPAVPETAAAALSRLRPGQHVRVAATGSDTIEGRFVTIRDGHLVLDRTGFVGSSSSSVPIESVRTAWVRGRGTKTGAVVGGVVGGLAGGVLVGFASGASCEVDSCRDDWLVAAVIGLAVGGAAGALTGSLIGAASPRWRVVYAAGSAGQSGAPPASSVAVGERSPRSDRIGSASLHLGYAKALDAIAPGGGAGGSLSWTAELGKVAPSLEIGWYGLGSRDLLTPRGESLHYEESLLYFGPAVSVGPSRGRVRPYARASLGFYSWKTFDPQVLDPESGVTEPVSHRNFLGGSLSGGVRLHTAGASFGLEGRWHTNVSGVPQVALHEPAQRLSVLSLTVGATLHW